MSHNLLPGLVLTFVTCAALAAPFPLRADPPATSPVQRAELSARLYLAGQEIGDAVMVLAAARLRQSIALTRAEDWPVAREGESMAHGAEKPLRAVDMLDAARALAAGDAALLGLIEDAEAERTKGVASGPLYNIGTLARGGRDRYDALLFRGGEYAEIYVEARSRADLRLTVTDAQGRLVCSDSDRSHIAYCGWRPDQPGRFTITLENRGQGTSYALMTN